MTLTVSDRPKTSRMSREECVARAEALGEAIAPYAEEAERIRRMPRPVIEAYKASGLSPLVRPAAYGGYEHDWMTFADVLAPIGRQSGAMSWCIGFLIQHQWAINYFDVSAQDEVYGTDPDPLIATSFSPRGSAQVVDGGFRLKGEWPFGSGSDHCDWAVVGALAEDIPGAAPRVHWFLLKPGQFHIKDTWHSAGLKGTGSNTIVVEETFIPKAFAVATAEIVAGRAPSHGAFTGPQFIAPQTSQFQFGLVCPMLSVAHALYDCFLGFNRGRVSVGIKAQENPLLQLRVGEAAAELKAARALMQELNDKLMAGTMARPDAALEFHMGIGYAAKLILQAGDRLFTASGGRGLDEGTPLSRHWRDLHAIANHGALQSDMMMQNFGRAALTPQ